MEIKNPKNVEADAGEMLVARIFLKRQKDGSGIFRDDVTPAEAVILAADGRPLVNMCPITDVTVTGTVKRSRVHELQRLQMRFGANKVRAAFPGANPEFPATFEQALETASQVSLPSESMITVDLAVPN